MKKHFFHAVLISLAAFATGCDNYAKYPIDEKPSIKPDRSLLGIWKPVADKNPANYVLIQDYIDVFNPTGKNILGSDEGKYGDYKSYNYYITQVTDVEGKTELDEWTAYTSKIGNATFLNLSASGLQSSGDDQDIENNARSTDEYFFIRVLGVNDMRNVITAVMVDDTTLKNLKGASQVRSYIAAHLNDPSFYGDTTRFYKVSGYHASLKQSMMIANPGKYKRVE